MLNNFFYQRINGISLGFFFILSGHVTLGFSKLSFFKNKSEIIIKSRNCIEILFTYCKCMFTFKLCCCITIIYKLYIKVNNKSKIT